MVTPQVEFPILGVGCLQDLELLWDHCLNEVVVERVHHRLKNLPSGRVSAPRIILQRDVILSAWCQADLTVLVVYQRPTQKELFTSGGEIRPGVMVARTLVPDQRQDLWVWVLT